MMNLNPAEIGSEWTFHLSGRPFKYDAFGQPKGRPGYGESYQIIASNFQASAKFLHAFFAAFTAVFLGWPMNEKKQVRLSTRLSTKICTNHA